MAIRRRTTEFVWIDAFAIKLADLETLYEEVGALMGRSGKPQQSLTVNDGLEEVTCDHPSELLDIQGLPDRVVRFTCVWNNRDRHLSMTVSRESQPYLYATAPDFAWCTGAIATVTRRMRAYRVWYRWMRKPYLLLVFLLTLGVGFVLYFLHPLAASIVLSTNLFLWLGVQYVTKRSLPAGLLILRETGSTWPGSSWKTALATIGIVVTVLSILITLLK